MMTKTELKAAQLVIARKLANELRDATTRLMLRQNHDCNGKAYCWQYVDLEGNQKSHCGYAVHDASETVKIQLWEDGLPESTEVTGDNWPESKLNRPLASNQYRTLDKSRIFAIRCITD